MIWTHVLTKTINSVKKLVVWRSMQNTYLHYYLVLQLSFLVFINLYERGEVDYVAVEKFLNEDVFTQETYTKSKERIDTELKYYYKKYWVSYETFVESVLIKINPFIGLLLWVEEIYESIETFIFFLKFKYYKSYHVYNNLPASRSRMMFRFFKKDNFFFKWFSSLYLGFKSLILPLIVTLTLLVILVDFYNINFTRQIAIWFVVGMLFFWLMSGFNFFLKRYRFGKFTSAIQRFWKRTNTYFWIVEGYLFLLFFYYYLNSSQEVLYFVDDINLSQNFITNLKTFYISSLLLLFLIFYCLFVLLNISSFNFKQAFSHLVVVTIFFIYGFLLESYQFYYVLTSFFELNWEFIEETKTWVLDFNAPWVRVKSQYFTLALIAKYWHFLFIFISWLFAMFKFYETKNVTYTLLGVNLQNYMLLFILNLLFNANWLKWLTRRHADEVYFWFFTDFNHWVVKVFIQEIYTFLESLYFLIKC